MIFKDFFLSEVTVFTQMPDTPHLLAVSCDATAVNVSDQHVWLPLSFQHVRIGNSDTKYSSIQVAGSQRHLAAPGARQWVPQLLPTIYDYSRTDHQGQSLSTSITSAGLIGSLPLLLALAAFSGPENQLDMILTQCLRRGVWASHTYARGGKLSAFFYQNWANLRRSGRPRACGEGLPRSDEFSRFNSRAPHRTTEWSFGSILWSLRLLAHLEK